MAAHPGQESEILKLRWRARAYAAEVRCRLGQGERARGDLDKLIGELHAMRPDGGVITREAEAIRRDCR